jgi:hypothetical protein
MRAEIEKAAKEVTYPEVVEALQVYEKEGKPFAAPSFKLQDRNSRKQRTSDLLGGFPFTSELYPWPLGGADSLHMQPVVQINLEKASRTLGFDFGEGLLQVWSVIGSSKNSLNVIDTAFSSDYSVGIFTRVIPLKETEKTPTDFYPQLAPWERLAEAERDSSAVLFINPSEAMAQGSVIKWKLSRELMYPIPHYSIHDIETLVPEPAERSEEIDPTDLFDEFTAAVSYCLKTPNAYHDCYLGGVRSYGEGREFDPAQEFALLLNIGGEINLSVIFDDKNFLKPEYLSSDDATRVHFARERMLRVVYYYAG